MSTAEANCYELDTNCYAVYSFEYNPGLVEDNGVSVFFSTSGIGPSPTLSNHRLMGPFLSLSQYSTWANYNKAACTMNAGGGAADERMNIGPTPRTDDTCLVFCAS